MITSIRKNNYGFGGLEIILLLIIVILIGAFGWYVYKSNSDTNTESKNTPASAATKSSTKVEPIASNDTTVKLASGAVLFKTPKTWTSSDVGCIKAAPAYSSTEYIDSTSLLPGEKLRTIYGDGTEYFYIGVCVFNNSSQVSPKNWFETILEAGYESSTDEISNDAINGNQAYYRKTINSVYTEVNYVISAKGKIIYVHARTYEPDSRLPGVGDFRKFEPAIKTLVDSITIN